MLRNEICNQEIWCECFGRKQEDMQPRDSYTIAAIVKRVGGWTRKNGLRRVSPYGQQRIYERVEQ